MLTNLTLSGIGVVAEACTCLSVSSKCLVTHVDRKADGGETRDCLADLHFGCETFQQ